MAPAITPSLSLLTQGAQADDTGIRPEKAPSAASPNH
jgi:hypothetical protein